MEQVRDLEDLEARSSRFQLDAGLGGRAPATTTDFVDASLFHLGDFDFCPRLAQGYDSLDAPATCSRHCASSLPTP